MYALRPLETSPEEDQRVVLHGMSWKDFEVILALRGDAPGVRMYYLDGAIELVSPSNIHEYRKKTLARLLEQWAVETDTNLNGYGSWTLKSAPDEAGGEPDECYVIGDGREVPDLVIEIEWSRAFGLDKREIYRRLGVRELWTLQRDLKLVVRALDKGKYAERTSSKILPQLDVAFLVGFLENEPQSAAVRALRDAMHAKRRPKKRRE
jgi:Uma2 family endonuclease